MMTRTFASVAVMAALGLLVPMQVNAFGLGKLELSSALNEPFKAEIAITALKGDDANNLQVRLASSKEFEQAGIERNFLLTQLKFDVVEKSGDVKIVISSQQPIREPFIDFLLTATTTGSGRLIREYTVLLDPPKSIFNKPGTPLVKSPAKTSANTTATTNTTTTTNYKSASFDGDSYGPVIRTDTLWDVALNTRPDNNVTVHQMMMALLKANPGAFQYDNVNGLKAGYTLSIPSKEDIYKLTKQQAINAFAEQNALWKNRNKRQTIEANTPDQTIAPIAENAPAIAKAVTTEITAPTTEVDDTARLKLVVPNDQPSLNDEALSPLGAEKIKVLSEQLTLAQETIEGQTQENIDFKARMDALEVQMETMRRLISLKDADLALLQSMLEKDQQPDENTLPADATVVDNAEADSKNKPLESTTVTKAIEDELESMFVMAQKIVINNKLEIAIAAGGLLLLLVALLIVKRRKESDEAEDWDETQNLVNNDDDDLVAVQPSNFADVQQTVEMAVTDKKTVAELIEQADMLVAYTDYEKAMALLEEAKQQEPANQLVLSKLLYVLFKQQAKEPFVTLASSLNINKASPEWLEIAEWGRELAPSNTLFQLTPDDNEPSSPLTLDSFSDVKDDELLAEPIVIQEVEEIAENESNTIEFNLDDYGSDDLVSSADSSIASLDEINYNDESLTFDTTFPLDDGDKKPAFDAPLNFEDDSDKGEDVLSLNDEPISLDLTDETYQTELLSTEDNLQDLDTDLDTENNEFEFDISGYDEIDEAETKLDLAAAYADMGDPDGARNILEEVLKEGNAEQKSKAQALLKDLS
jgi:pilus assembly protein FimV